jgi:hypothetical protein
MLKIYWSVERLLEYQETYLQGFINKNNYTKFMENVPFVQISVLLIIKEHHTILDHAGLTFKQEGHKKCILFP